MASVSPSDKKEPLLTLEEKKRLLNVESANKWQFIIVFPLPSHTTAEDNKAFFRQNLKVGKSYLTILEDAIVCKQLKDTAEIKCAENLESLRTCVIETFLSFFKTLGKRQHCDAVTFTSRDKDELFLCLNISDGLAETLADLGEYPLQLDLSAIEKLGIKITNQKDLVPSYVKYDEFMKREGLLKTYEKAHKPGEFSIVRQVDKICLLYDAITDYIDIHDLEEAGLVTHVFPAHNLPQLEPLKQKWGRFKFSFSLGAPIDDIRDYFGEEVAFYFLYIMTIVKGLAILSLLSIPATFFLFKGYASETKLVFTFVNMIWFTALVKAWRRTEAWYSVKWGMDRKSAGSIKDKLNPDFDDDPLPSPLDENMLVLRANQGKQIVGWTVSIIVMIVFIGTVILSAAANQYFAASMSKAGNQLAFSLTGYMLTVQIKIFDAIWNTLGTKLTLMEQHVTEHGFNQSKALKTFLMKFINAFNVFVYIGFFQQSMDPATCKLEGGCPEYLVKQLVIVFCTYIAFGVLDIALPLIMMKLEIRKEEQEMKKLQGDSENAGEVVALGSLELQAKMLPYTGADATSDYLQVVLPLGFIVLFSAVAPYISILCFIALATQHRADAWKLINAYKRTFPVRANGCGVWTGVLVALSYMSVAANIGLLITQVPHLGKYLPIVGRHQPLVVFFVLENIFVLFKLGFDVLVPNVGPKTLLEIQRHELQRQRVFEAQVSDFNADIKLACTGDALTTKFERLRGLKPGDKNYTSMKPGPLF